MITSSVRTRSLRTSRAGRVRLVAESDIPGVRLIHGIQQVRDTAVDPHRGHVVAPHLQEVAPADAGVVMEDPVERGAPGANALGGIARHPSPIDGSVLRRVT